MKKPTKQKRPAAVYKWSECVKYLEKKYKFDLRNFAGYTYQPDDTKPYQDFWHFICDTQCPDNGSIIYFDIDSIEDCKENWQITIMQNILSEFGKGKDRRCEFLVEW